MNNHGDKRGLHPNSLNNLEKGRKNGFKKGKSGNSNGQSITAIIKEMLNEPADERWLDVADKGKGKTWRQMVAQALLIGAVRGNPGLIKELLDRLEGKVTQPVQNDGKVELEIIYHDKLEEDC